MIFVCIYKPYFNSSHIIILLVYIILYLKQNNAIISTAQTLKFYFLNYLKALDVLYKYLIYNTMYCVQLLFEQK